MILALLLSIPAHAQQRFGVRAGVSVDPEQFYFGGHILMGPVAGSLSFRPNVEVGFGDHVALVGFNGELVYKRPLPSSRWDVYFGGGPALVFTSFRRGGSAGEPHTDAGPGFNMLLGIGQDRGLFAEFKVGALDSPGLKFGIGYTFR
jgi:hypothetical protein